MIDKPLFCRILGELDAGEIPAPRIFLIEQFGTGRGALCSSVMISYLNVGLEHLASGLRARNSKRVAWDLSSFVGWLVFASQIGYR